jgi:uncharacterized protein
MDFSRRNLFKNIWRGTLFAGFCSAVDAFAIEPNLIVTNEIDLAIEKLPPRFVGKKIAHISDLHCGSCCGEDFLIGAIEKINTHNPDITILTGDFTSRYDDGEYYHLLGGIVKHTKSPLGTFACMGNHDYGLSVKTKQNIRVLTTAELEKNGVTVLRNSSHTITIADRSIQLIGLGELLRGDCYPNRAFENLTPNTPRIVIAHNPDCFRRMKGREFDALLCGHTHGGQVCIPFHGPLLVPNYDKRFKSGKYLIDEKFVYVNRGLATLPTRLIGPRFFCPPEITIFKLTEKT